MNQIKVLPEQVANKIAAGEVVERPASVVKELIENALDAGATDIEIEIQGGGRARICVTDNGRGMSPEDAKLAFERHATSKISDLEDIYRIKTLGFRGEALPSIASISSIEMVTSEKGAKTGTRIQMEAGKLKACEAAAPQEGTRIIVSNLFFNTPARRKFLKGDKTELRHIVSTVTLAAMVQLNVGFKLTHDGRTLVDIPKQSDLSERLKLLLGKEFASDTLTLGAKRNGLQITGKIGKPTLNRGNRLSQYFFVNGRPIQSRSLSFALYQGFETLLMTQRYPVGIIFIEVDPGELDVNIHPTKKEVRFSDEHKVRNLLVKGIKETLSQSQFVPTFKKPLEEGGDSKREESLPLSTHLRESIASYTPTSSPKPIEESTVSSSEEFISKVLGVIQDTYIVCETDSGMLMIDQHAAHERLLFEKVLLDFQSSNVEVQQLLLPEMVELSPADSALIEPYLKFLNKVGVSIASFGKNSFVVDGLPVYFKNQPILELVRGMIEEIEQSGKVLTHEKTQEKLAALISCKAAVKAGDKLKPEESESLAARAFLNLQNKTCPHGRPVMIQLSADELARQFKRK